MSKIKAFIFAGSPQEYRNFLRENRLTSAEYPMIGEYNWRGVENADIIRVGSYMSNTRMFDIVRYAENYILARKVAEKIKK